MIAVTDKQPEARIRYVWLNRQSNRVEPKVAWLHREGDYVVGVGYHAPAPPPTTPASSSTPPAPR
jgi:cytochrome c